MPANTVSVTLTIFGLPLGGDVAAAVNRIAQVALKETPADGGFTLDVQQDQQ